MQLSDHLTLENVAIDLPSVSKRKLLRQLADTASRQAGIEADIIARSFLPAKASAPQVPAGASLFRTRLSKGYERPQGLAEGVEWADADVAVDDSDRTE
ncbi:MAG: hypothetical protein ACT6U0_00940 [Shinella sp.]|uniref:hypothetical protein n=1 Tax=Shinella sp. TaxID=1870904 RepID=UPI00403680B6